MKLSTVDTFKTIRHAPPGSVVLEGELLRKYQLTLLGIAEDMVDVLEEEGLTWHLTGGSALGAVRHGGFIPWDDDMDFDILGDDFERFLSAFRRKYGDKYWIHTPSTPNYGMVTCRVRLKNSVCRAREDVGNPEAGFFVDFNAIENTFDNPVLRAAHGVLCMGMGLLLSCRCFYKNRGLMLSLAKENPELRPVFLTKILLGAPLSLFPVSAWASLTEKCHRLCRNSRSAWVSVPAGRRHFFGELYRRRDFVETAEMPFEGHLWKVPKDYDGYLRHMYGDYAALPPEDEREKHIVLELKFPENQE